MTLALLEVSGSEESARSVELPSSSPMRRGMPRTGVNLLDGVTGGA